MERRAPRVLVAAAIPEAVRKISVALTGLQVTTAQTFEEAVQRFREETFDLVVVGYHFCELHPFRLIQHIRDKSGKEGSTPIILIRTLPFLLGQDNLNDIRTAYKDFGVDEFISLYDDEQRLGVEAALGQFRGVVMRMIDTPAAME